MKRRKLSPMSRDKLESLSTPRLLARLKQLHRCEESASLSDQSVNELTLNEFIEFKESSEWIAEYDLLKNILSQRENVPSKT